MNNEVQEQMRIIKMECFKLAQMLTYDRIRLEYNSNRRINDNGKLDLMPIIHCYSS